MSERVEAASTKAETQTPSPTTGPADSSSQRRGLRGLEPAVQMARLDPEQQPGFDAQALALLPTGALDLRNFGTWAQSGLNLVDQRVPFLARPLDVDGTVGPKTTQATKGFQGVAPQIVPGAVLPRTGRFDAATVWALEEATSSKNPAGRKSEPPRKAGLSTAAAEAGGSAVDGAQGRDPVDAAPVAPEMSEAAIQLGLQAAIQQVAPAGMSPSSAYAAIKAETLARFDDLSDKDTKRARDKLARDFAAELAKGRVSADQEPAWTRAGFFKAYWMLHCDQFANALMAKINGGALPSLNALRDRTNRAIDAKGGDPGATGATEVAGRDLAYRGATLTSLGARLKADNAEPGIGVHVKLRYTSDRPYDPSVVDELHHWFVYIGDGKFSDSFGAGQTGPSCDTFMVNWMNRDFHNRGRPNETFDFSFFHTEDYANQSDLDEMKRLHAGADSEKAEADAMKVMPGDKASRDAKRAAMKKARATERAARGDAEVKKKTLPRPRSGIQPKVSAIYRPTRARKSPGGGAP